MTTTLGLDAGSLVFEMGVLLLLLNFIELENSDFTAYITTNFCFLGAKVLSV